LLFVISLLILALDTTTRTGSIAVAEDDHVLALVPGDATRTHGERLPAEIAATLDRAGVSLDRLDLLAVATGPGGFTGLRIGLAAIQGLAMTLNKPVAGVSALDALAEQIPVTDGTVIVPWMDAQRGDVYATLIDARSRLTIEAAVAESPGALLDRWRPHFAGRHVIFIGDAVTRDQALLDQAGNRQWRTRRPEALAPHIARLARRLSEQGKAGPPHALIPTYIRRPDAEIDRDKRRPKADAERGGIESKG
jgi:tRNA threonylcarbamoyladenosine biosynthesis protein TsaB